MNSEECIDEFGKSVPDLNSVSTINAILNDEWVYLEGEPPFRVRMIDQFVFCEATKFWSTIILKNGRVIFCNDAAKLMLVKELFERLRKRVTLSPVGATFPGSDL